MPTKSSAASAKATGSASVNIITAFLTYANEVITMVKDNLDAPISDRVSSFCDILQRWEVEFSRNTASMRFPDYDNELETLLEMWCPHKEKSWAKKITWLVEKDAPKLSLKEKIARLKSGKALSDTIAKTSSGKGKAPVTAVSSTSWHVISPFPDNEDVAVPPPVRKTRGPLAPSKTAKRSLPAVSLPKAAPSPSVRKVSSSPNAKFFDPPKQKGGPRITAEDSIEDLANFERQFEDAKTTTTSATLPKALASVPLVAKAKRTGGTSKLVRPATSSPVATLSKLAPSRPSIPAQSKSMASLPGPSKSSSSAYKPLPAISFSKMSTSTPYVRPAPRPLTRSSSQVFVEVPPCVRSRHFISKPTISTDDEQDDAPLARLHKRPLETSTENADDDANTPRPLVKKVRRDSPERSTSPIDTFESQTQPTPSSSPDLSNVDSERNIVIPEPPQATPPEFRKIDLTADKSDDTRGKTDKELDKDDAKTVGKMILDDDFPADYVLPSRFLDLEAQENNKGELPVSSEEDDIEVVTSPLLSVIPPPTINESEMEAFYGDWLLQLGYSHTAPVASPLSHASEWLSLMAITPSVALPPSRLQFLLSFAHNRETEWETRLKQLREDVDNILAQTRQASSGLDVARRYQRDLSLMIAYQESHGINLDWLKEHGLVESLEENVKPAKESTAEDEAAGKF
ncbi:hypothetical protein H0H93_004581 [Arthromyces matolae]|nr:hypothetical protein H0H93_004581 [Arthromyces matolae]